MQGVAHFEDDEPNLDNSVAASDRVWQCTEQVHPVEHLTSCNSVNNEL